MSTTVERSRFEAARVAEPEHVGDGLRYVVPVARFLFAAIFLAAVPAHFTRGLVDAAAQHGVPLATVAVPLAGILAGVGGLSVLFGVRARVGAWLLVVFLIPVTIFMHDFWSTQDPAMANVQRIMFMKNLAMLGGALLIAYFGAGPVSVDATRRSRSMA
jgi:putative oxidoreductase